MISVEIPNDIAEYKPKLMFSLTGKQLAYVALTAIAIFFDYKFLKPYVGDFLTLVVAAIPAFFAAMFGWGEKFTPGNVPFDKFLKTIFIQTFVAPKTRKCKTISSMIVPCDKYYEPVSDSELPSEVLEAVNYVREQIGIVVEDNDGNLNEKKHKQQTKKKTSKYKKSKLAIA